jgi:sarcosine oxidase
MQREVRMADVFDAIVVGLGAMGSAATYQLAKRGASVLGIDQLKPPHEFGSTHGDTRITRIACGEGPEYSPFARRSHDIWRELEAATGRDLFTQNGMLVISGKGKRAAGHENEKFLETTINAAQAADVNYEKLDGKAIRERFPAFNVREDDEAYFDQVSGFVRPELCIEAQLQLASVSGATLRFHEKMLQFEASGDEVRVTTAAGSYRAKRLILTAGPWINEVLRLDCEFRITRQVLYWFRLRSDSASRNFAPERCPVYIWQIPAPQVIYGFPLIGRPDEGVKIATEQYEDTTTPDSVRRSVSPDEISEMFKTYVHPYFPDLDDTCVKAKVCLYTCVPRARFIVDRHPRMKNVIVASPCSGHGFKHSAAIGETLAQMALGHHHLDLSKFSFPQA